MAWVRQLLPLAQELARGLATGLAVAAGSHCPGCPRCPECPSCAPTLTCGALQCAGGQSTETATGGCSLFAVSVLCCIFGHVGFGAGRWRSEPHLEVESLTKGKTKGHGVWLSVRDH